MYKIPRFDSFNEDEKKKEVKDDDWHQHITLPLPPAVVDFSNKYKEWLTNNDGTSITSERGTEHIFSAIADLIRAIEPQIDVKELIDYLLDRKDLVKCQPTEEP